VQENDLPLQKRFTNSGTFLVEVVYIIQFLFPLQAGTANSSQVFLYVLNVLYG